MMRSRPCPPSHHHNHRRNNNTLSLTPGRYTPSTLFTPQHFKCPNNGSGAHCRLVCIPIASNASMQPCTPPPHHIKHTPIASYSLPSTTSVHPHHIVHVPIASNVSMLLFTRHHRPQCTHIALYAHPSRCTHPHHVVRTTIPLNTSPSHCISPCCSVRTFIAPNGAPSYRVTICILTA